MSFKDQLDLLDTKIDILAQRVIQLFKAKVPTAGTADNALALNGKTADQMQADAQTAINNHANRRDNPHGVTPAQIGAYTQAQIDALIAARLPSGIIPVSRYGALDTASLPVRSGGGWILSFTAAVPVILAGNYYSLPAQNIDLSTRSATPGNKTFYVYAKLVAGVISYSVTDIVQAESMTVMFIGTVTTNASTIATISLEKVTRLDTYRVSTSARGSALAVSTGQPHESAHLSWT